MTTFDKLMMVLSKAAAAGAAIGVAGGVPKWLSIACILVAAGTSAVAPSVIPSKRAATPDPAPSPAPAPAP